ncbi:uncharacterized protein BDR25DRAFT_349971 [Lindgomyces ingoldianus]|uniref:Uncharacterized protein n=1 Tax=Lindgomyces ingoldianus TaxID=673940 RepID=A0ACB6RBG0_9PLEO|nr:uncharacterized protein BDR25DRAFT_349971 [Lindgomyces ingoldianus]KAF2475685.1 hypothetical protein BDR25DRAFT_349971 [Lindgomyces ingoldianus]
MMSISQWYLAFSDTFSQVVCQKATGRFAILFTYTNLPPSDRACGVLLAMTGDDVDVIRSQKESEMSLDDKYASSEIPITSTTPSIQYIHFCGVIYSRLPKRAERYDLPTFSLTSCVHVIRGPAVTFTSDGFQPLLPRCTLDPLTDFCLSFPRIFRLPHTLLLFLYSSLFFSPMPDLDTYLPMPMKLCSRLKFSKSPFLFSLRCVSHLYLSRDGLLVFRICMSLLKSSKTGKCIFDSRRNFLLFRFSFLVTVIAQCGVLIWGCESVRAKVGEGRCWCSFALLSFGSTPSADIVNRIGHPLVGGNTICLFPIASGPASFLTSPLSMLHFGIEHPTFLSIFHFRFASTFLSFAEGLLSRALKIRWINKWESHSRMNFTTSGNYFNQLRYEQASKLLMEDVGAMQLRRLCSLGRLNLGRVTSLYIPARLVTWVHQYLEAGRTAVWSEKTISIEILATSHRRLGGGVETMKGESHGKGLCGRNSSNLGVDPFLQDLLLQFPSPYRRIVSSLLCDSDPALAREAMEGMLQGEASKDAHFAFLLPLTHRAEYSFFEWRCIHRDLATIDWNPISLRIRHLAHCILPIWSENPSNRAQKRAQRAEPKLRLRSHDMKELTPHQALTVYKPPTQQRTSISLPLTRARSEYPVHVIVASRLLTFATTPYYPNRIGLLLPPINNFYSKTQWFKLIPFNKHQSCEKLQIALSYYLLLFHTASATLHSHSRRYNTVVAATVPPQKPDAFFQEQLTISIPPLPDPARFASLFAHTRLSHQPFPPPYNSTKAAKMWPYKFKPRRRYLLWSNCCYPDCTQRIHMGGRHDLGMVLCRYHEPALRRIVEDMYWKWWKGDDEPRGSTPGELTPDTKRSNATAGTRGGPLMDERKNQNEREGKFGLREERMVCPIPEPIQWFSGPIVTSPNCKPSHIPIRFSGKIMHHYRADHEQTCTIDAPKPGHILYIGNQETYYIRFLLLFTRD